MPPLYQLFIQFSPSQAMELSLMASSSSPTRLLPLAQSLHLLQREIHVPIWSKPFSSLKVHLSERSGRSLVVAGAKNKKKNKSSEKVDDHSFVSRPDEATGPFPEAVLLKKVPFFFFGISLILILLECSCSLGKSFNLFKWKGCLKLYDFDLFG